jgi:hypothetical protein
MDRATEAPTAVAEPEPLRPNALPAAMTGLPAQVLLLQRSAGNRATMRLLQRDGPDAGVTAPDATAPPPDGPGCLATAPDAPQPGPPPAATAPAAAPPVPAAPSTAPTAPAAPAAPAGTGWLATPVADAAHPVGFTDMADDGRHVRDLPTDQAFGGLAPVATFAAGMRDEILRRGRPRLTAEILSGLRAQARTAATAERITGETSAARRARIQAAVDAVATPTDAEVDAVILERLRAHFAEHLASRQAPGMSVSGLANAWMRNRQEALLFETETVRRPRDQARMWTNLWIEPEAEDEEPVESHPPGVSLDTAAGGRAAGDGARVDPRTVTFLDAFHARFPHVTFGTYMGHGSGGFQRRGLSVDINLSGRGYQESNARGFWNRDRVVELFEALDATAQALDYRYFAIYNDFAVARHVNERARFGNVGFAGGVDSGGALNYHGGGIKLHVHLDLVPPDLRASDNPSRREGAQGRRDARTRFLRDLSAREAAERREARAAAQRERDAARAAGRPGVARQAIQRTPSDRREAARAIARQCAIAQAGPSAEERQEATDNVMRTALRCATEGWPGVEIAITNQDCRLLTGYRMQGDPGGPQRAAAPSITDDLRTTLRWTFDSPGVYRIVLTRNTRGELQLGSWEPSQRLTNHPNVVVVIGSPSPDQAYKLQFVTAALREQGDATWYVERTGYELAHVDLDEITRRAPGGRVNWITPERPLVDQLNTLPRDTVRRMVVYSHGLQGIATLRYGWGGTNPDYGINRDDARRIDGGIFTGDALVDLESCQGGTNLEGGSLAQAIADRTHHNVIGWTGRTSYADVNAGRGGVRGSEYTRSSDALREFWVRNVVAGDTPRRATFAPRPSP